MLLLKSYYRHSQCPRTFATRRQNHSLVPRVRNTIRFNPIAPVDELESKQDMLAWEAFKFRVLCQVITAVPKVLAVAGIDRIRVTQAHGMVIYAHLNDVLGSVKSHLCCPCTTLSQSFSDRKLPLHGNWRGGRSCERKNVVSTPAQTRSSTRSASLTLSVAEATVRRLIQGTARPAQP